jgi:hypothetical protein
VRVRCLVCCSCTVTPPATDSEALRSALRSPCLCVFSVRMISAPSTTKRRHPQCWTDLCGSERRMPTRGDGGVGPQDGGDQDAALQSFVGVLRWCASFPGLTIQMPLQARCVQGLLANLRLPRIRLFCGITFGETSCESCSRVLAVSENASKMKSLERIPCQMRVSNLLCRS